MLLELRLGFGQFGHSFGIVQLFIEGNRLIFKLPFRMDTKYIEQQKKDVKKRLKGDVKKKKKMTQRCYTL